MTPSTFGAMLFQLRKRVGMTQADLAAAVGYSPSLISSLEKGKRQIEVRAVIDLFVPALALHDEPRLATYLVELAAIARGERPPASLNFGQNFQPASVPASQESSHPLPSPPTALVGREDDVRLLVNRFIGHGGRLMTLIGAPGVGKTRLALEAAARLKPQFEDGVRFIPLASIRDADRVPLTISSALEIPDNGKLSPQKSLIQALRHKEQLLVLDNFEQILAAAPFLAELLAECARLHLLITSRERLHLRAEQRFPVQPLALAAATQLFLRCAQSAAPDFCYHSDHQATIEAICQRVDCLPLAIELVASRLDMFTPQMILAQLQKRGIDLLQDGPSDLPAHHRTLRATIFDSYALLNEKEKRLFRTLSVFRGGFDLEALQSVGGDEETLRGLLNKSLVVQERQFTTGQRFFLLETLQEFAQEQLEISGERRVARNLHLQHFLTLVEELDTGMSSESQKLQVEKIQTNYENILTAIRWAIAQRNAESAARFVWSLRLFWFWIPRWTEARVILNEILACVEHEWHSLVTDTPALLTPQQRLHLALFAKVLFTCSDLANDSSAAEQLLNRCTTVNAMVEPDSLTPALLHSLSLLNTERGDFAEAIRLNQRCLQLLDDIADISEDVRKSEIAWTYKFLGLNALQQNDLAGCRKYFSQSVAVFTAINQSNMVAIDILRLCEAELYLGELEQARSLFDTCANTLMVSDYQLAFPLLYRIATTLAIRQQQWQAAKAVIRQGAQFLVNHPQEYIQWQDPFLLVGKYMWLVWREKQFDHAAQLVGMVEALRQQCIERPFAVCLAEYDSTVACVRTALDESTFATCYAKGHTMKNEEIFAWILEKTAEG